MLHCQEDRVVDTLTLAWKVVSFYDLTPQTLARLTRVYGLQEYGGFLDIDRTEKEQLQRRIDFGLTAETDPRVRYCLWHQLMISRRAQDLRMRGYRAEVKGWLVVVHGGRQTRLHAKRGLSRRRVTPSRFGQSQ
jgi:hypothetical protein